MSYIILTLKKIFTILLISTALFGAELAYQKIDFKFGARSGCDSGYKGTWVIDSVCAIGSKADIKIKDVIHIQCDIGTDRWSIDFYKAHAESQVIRYEVCPGNGFLTTDRDGKAMLQCNFWEPKSNVAKRLEFILEPVTNPYTRRIRWLSRETNNPNVICGVPDWPDASKTGGIGSSLLDD